MDEAALTITQERFLRGRLTLTLEGSKLKSEYRQGLSRHEYRFHLHRLLPDPIRTRHVPIWRIVGAVVVLGFSMVYAAVGIIGFAPYRLEDRAAMFTAAGALLVLGVAASASAAKHAVNAVVFTGPGGQMVLWPGLPNKEEFDRFITLLIERIKEAQGYEQSLLQHLRRAEIITDWQYDQAMELLRKDGHADR